LISRPVSEANENAAEVLQQLRERILMALARGESLSICGQGSKAFYGRRTLISAGTYSLLQPAMSQELKQRKLTALQAGQPDVILSANVGCMLHLQSGTSTPVRHWIELLDERLA
jgi:hypothetical protein